MPGLRNGAVPDPQAITPAPSSRQIAIAMARLALDAKADDVVVLDLRRLSYSFDFFVLCSAFSDRHSRAIADDIQEKFSGRGIHPRHLEGRRDSGWTLLDYGPVVTHIFSPEMRRFYNLDRLWADAPRLSQGTISGRQSPSKALRRP